MPEIKPPPLRNDCFALPPGVDWTPVDEAKALLKMPYPLLCLPVSVSQLRTDLIASYRVTWTRFAQIHPAQTLPLTVLVLQAPSQRVHRS